MVMSYWKGMPMPPPIRAWRGQYRAKQKFSKMQQSSRAAARNPRCPYYVRWGAYWLTQLWILHARFRTMVNADPQGGDLNRREY